MVSQSSAKDQIYDTVHYATLNAICVAQRASKDLKKTVEDKIRSQSE
jgi:hypothetical protein